MAALAALLAGSAAQPGSDAGGGETDPMAALAALAGLLGPRARCITAGEEGTVVQGPHGDSSWFREEQLARADGARADGSTRPAVGDRVVLQEA